jgi:hypothetical protein
MAVTARDNFSPDILWAGGSGCLVCGSNVSAEGDKVGIRCIDLGVDDEFLGRFGLCYDCGIQVARVIGFVSKDSIAAQLADAEGKAAEAHATLIAAQAETAQARLDKDTVERLLGSVYAEAT